MNKSLEELSDASMVRRQLVERARENLRQFSYTLHPKDLENVIGDVLHVLESYEDHERRLLHLHAECASLIGYCQRVLRQLAEQETTAIFKITEPPKG